MTSCPKAENYHDEWDQLISEFGLESEPMGLPLRKTDLRSKLLSRGMPQNSQPQQEEDSI